MAQKKITVVQIESGKQGFDTLGARLNGIDTAINDLNESLQDSNLASETGIAKVNEALMAAIQTPVPTPIMYDISSYTVQATDILQGQPITINLPQGKSYLVGKNHLQVLRNGVPQILENGDYTETSPTTIQFAADVLEEGDVLTFIIGTSSKLSYNVSVSYYDSGDNAGLIQTITYTGDVNKTVTYNYNAQKKISSEVVVEDGKTTTRTFTYDDDGKLIGIAVTVT